MTDIEKIIRLIYARNYNILRDRTIYAYKTMDELINDLSVRKIKLDNEKRIHITFNMGIYGQPKVDEYIRDIDNGVYQESCPSYKLREVIGDYCEQGCLVCWKKSFEYLEKTEIMFDKRYWRI